MLNQDIINKKNIDISIDVYEPHLYTSNSTIPGAGIGVFSNSDIPNNTIITEYKGEYSPNTKTFPPHIEKYIFETNNGIYINPYRETIARYINDTIDLSSTFKHNKLIYHTNKKYNVGWLILDDDDEDDDLKKEIVYIYTIVPVNKNEELFINYGSNYWHNYIS